MVGDADQVFKAQAAAEVKNHLGGTAADITRHIQAGIGLHQRGPHALRLRKQAWCLREEVAKQITAGHARRLSGEKLASLLRAELYPGLEAGISRQFHQRQWFAALAGGRELYVQRLQQLRQ